MNRTRRTAVAAAAVAVAAAVAAAALTLGGDDEERAAPRPAASTTSAPTTSAPATQEAEGPLDAPDRLVIGAIDVDAPVVGVGTTPDNAQEVPTSLEETGWWRDGQQPGDPGNAVIVGHTASKGDGVFDELDDLEPGDELSVRSGAKTRTFTVTSEEVVDVADFGSVADDVYRESGPSGLVLMTCGDWDGDRFTTTVIVHATAR